MSAVATPRARRGRHFVRNGTSLLHRIDLMLVAILSSLLLLVVCWSLATPVFSGPDEPAHVTRAASAVRGQIVATPASGPSDPDTKVRIPQSYSVGDQMNQCYRWDPNQPASCAPNLRLDSKTVTSLTAAGRYPPLYYALVGWPSLLVSAPTGVYLMRIVSAAMSVVMLGLGFFAVRRWSSRRWLPIGILVAVTPTTLYLSSVVNPNGLEVTAATTLWLSSLILFDEHLKDCPVGLLSIVTLSGITLTLMRGLSPVWTVLILLFSMAGTSVGPILRAVVTRQRLRMSVLVFAAAGMLAAYWIVHEHSLDLVAGGSQINPKWSDAHVFLLSLQSGKYWMIQMVGVFGWLNVYPPSWATDVWYACAALLVAVGLGWGRARSVANALAMGLVGVFLPTILEYLNARRSGLVWQGRYLLPFAVGIPIYLLSTMKTTRGAERLRRGVVPIVAAGLAVVQVASLYQTLRRYTVGARGSLSLDGRWQPPGGSTWIVALSIVSAALFYFTVNALASEQRAIDAEDPTEADGYPLVERVAAEYL